MSIAKRTISFFAMFQNFAKSSIVHGNSYKNELNGKSMVEYEMHLDKEASFDDLGNGYRQVIIDYSKKSNVAVDIGAGTGWLSLFLNQFFKTVISVEPSTSGIELSKELVAKIPSESKLIYFNQKAEDFLTTAKFNLPTFIFFQTVLSHLPNKQVKKILTSMDDSFPLGSLILFSEVFGDRYQEPMWYVRDKLWWQSNLPNWELNFFGEKLVDRPEYKGFTALRIR